MNNKGITSNLIVTFVNGENLFYNIHSVLDGSSNITGKDLLDSTELLLSELESKHGELVGQNNLTDEGVRLVTRIGRALRSLEYNNFLNIPDNFSDIFYHPKYA